MLPDVSYIIKAKAAERKLEILIPEYARLGWPWQMFAEHYPEDIALILPDQVPALLLLHKRNYQPPDLYEIGFDEISKDSPGVGSDGAKVLDFIKCTGEPYYHNRKFFSSIPVDAVLSMAPTLKFSPPEVSSCLTRLENHGYLIRIGDLLLLSTKDSGSDAKPTIEEEPVEIDIPIEHDAEEEPSPSPKIVKEMKAPPKEPVRDDFIANWVDLYESALPDARRIFEENGHSYWGIREDELARLTNNTSERISEIMSLIAQSGRAIRSVQVDSEPASKGLKIRNQTTKVYWGILSGLCKKAKKVASYPHQSPKVPESSVRKGRRKYHFPEGKQGVTQTKIVRYICTEGVDVTLGKFALRISFQSAVLDAAKTRAYSHKKVKDEMSRLWEHGVLVKIQQETSTKGRPIWGIMYSPELYECLVETDLTSDFSLEIPDNGARRELFMSKEMIDSLLRKLSAKD